MINSSEVFRGLSKLIILSILNESEGHGYLINKKLYNKSDGVFDLTEATLYNTLKALEREAFTESYYQLSEQGKNRKIYRITKKGRKYLAQIKCEWKDINMIINKIVGEKS